MLTKKQRDLLILIHERLAKGDVVPSFDEMKDALGLKSKSGIHRLIGALEERGFLERLPNKARALNILKLPDGYQPQDFDQTEVAQKIRGHMVSSSPSHGGGAHDDSVVDVPLCGKIAAGTPIEAIAHEGDVMSFPAGIVGRGDYYALVIDGDSMINAGIHDGDTVIIQRCDSAENGAIVVALVDGEEATLKTLQRSGNKIILQPENSSHEPQVLDPQRVQIQGRLVSLMRTYH